MNLSAASSALIHLPARAFVPAMQAAFAVHAKVNRMIDRPLAERRALRERAVRMIVSKALREG